RCRDLRRARAPVGARRSVHDKGRAVGGPDRASAVRLEPHVPDRSVRPAPSNERDDRPPTPRPRHRRIVAVVARLLAADLHRCGRHQPRPHLFAFSFGPFVGFWSAFAGAEQLGALCITGGAMSSVERVAAIIATEATVLMCTPTYALRLGEAARAE